MAGFVSQQRIFLNPLMPFLLKRSSRLILVYNCIVFTAEFVLATPVVMRKAVDSLYVPVREAKLLRCVAVIIGLRRTHQELQAQRGLNCKLYQFQYNDQEVDGCQT
jgi:hypothetical protein